MAAKSILIPSQTLYVSLLHTCIINRHYLFIQKMHRTCKTTYCTILGKVILKLLLTYTQFPIDFSIKICLN
jgi:magnesium-transporting ATPase (P-type)